MFIISFTAIMNGTFIYVYANAGVSPSLLTVVIDDLFIFLYVK